MRVVTLASLIRQSEKMREDMAQQLTDVEWWNEHRTDATPFDTGYYRVGLKLIDA